MNPTEARARAAFSLQAQWCARLSSPFTARLCALLGKRLDGATATGRRVLSWSGNPDPTADAVALRLAGGLHALVRRGRLPALAACYPPHPCPDDDRLWAAIDHALKDADDELLSWLDSPPQTNEVGRSAALMAGLLCVAARYDLPMALYELGASAGLNLVLDRYGYRLGDREAGDMRSPLILQPEWEGPAPPAARVDIAFRRGVDLNPLDIANAQDRERLLAYVWPDQAARLAQLEAAIGLACFDPPPIDRGDAAEWLLAHLDTEPAIGIARVVMHSLAYQYFPADVQARIRDHIERVGAAASEDAPLAWLRYEMAPEAGNEPMLKLSLWPTGEERLLAVGHPHVRSLKWLAAA